MPRVAVGVLSSYPVGSLLLEMKRKEPAAKLISTCLLVLSTSQTTSNGSCSCRVPSPAPWCMPRLRLRSTFGETLDGPVADIVVRNWGVLITLVGAMLIYGAFNPQVRSMVLLAAGASKLAFIALVLSHGGPFVAHQAGIAVAIDLLWVALFAWYLVGARTARHGSP